MPSRRYTYCPPARGNIAASSPYVIAPMRVTMPDSVQTTSSRPGAWTWRRISAETMKIPEPIIDPTTSAVASSREIALTKSVWGCWVVAIWRGNLVSPAWRLYVLGRCYSLSHEDDRAPLAPGRRVLRFVRRGRHAQQGRGPA